MIVTVIRKAHFNAAHRLYRKDWDMEKNDSVFGLCNNPNFHGHNYDLEAHVTGPIDPETGFVIDLKILKDILKVEIHDRFDHKNLNEDCPEFFNLNPTAENIAMVIYKIVKSKLDTKFQLKIRLYETDNNFVEVYE